MTTTDFSTSFSVGRTPEVVFDAVTNVRGWWSEDIDGNTANQGDEFYYRYKDVHQCWVKIIEVVPQRKLVWLVKDNLFSFTQDKHEWQGTRIVFDILPGKKETELQFTHVGLVPTFECYDVCHEGWTNYINHSLRNLIAHGKGAPNPKEGGFNETVVKRRKLK